MKTKTEEQINQEPSKPKHSKFNSFLDKYNMIIILTFIVTMGLGGFGLYYLLTGREDYMIFFYTASFMIMFLVLVIHLTSEKRQSEMQRESAARQKELKQERKTYYEMTSGK